MAPRDEELVDEEPPAIEPYKVLGITEKATEDEVKAAYRKAALKHHPGKPRRPSLLRFPSSCESRLDLILEFNKQYDSLFNLLITLCRQGPSTPQRYCPYQIPRSRIRLCDSFRPHTSEAVRCYRLDIGIYRRRWGVQLRRVLPGAVQRRSHRRCDRGVLKNLQGFRRGER